MIFKYIGENVCLFKFTGLSFLFSYNFVEAFVSGQIKLRCRWKKLEYRVFHSGVDYFEVKYLANPLPDLFQILHGEPGDMYN